MSIQTFIHAVQTIHATGQATEHSYRAAIGALIDAQSKDISAINEPKREKCGAPDFIVNLKDVAIGHIEAKDIDVDLRVMKGANADQKKRYLAGLPNLIYTNCLDWDFYRNGALYASVSIGDPLMGIQPRPDNFETLQNLLQDFIAQRPQTIASSQQLAKMMAGKAALIKDVMSKALADEEDQNPELEDQFQAFKKQLIHDISRPDFADIYAETITYGLFAARLHDPTLKTFSRQEALELLPKSNPFLRKFFGYIAGPDLDDRLVWIIDDLAAVFLACDVYKMLESYGEVTGRSDPFLHFYEDFLTAYNPAKRKARGVWYTPEPVVQFIVRSIDQVLKTEFGLPLGLADTSKVTIDWETGQTDRKGKRDTIKKEVHRVQILDPATGTGTFLAEVIKQIAPTIQDRAPGLWSGYIQADLIPRLHGFELLMASYAMCHMKLDMILTELGYQPAGANPPRLGVYLTNSLEEGETANQTLPFARWLSEEAKGANAIKRDTPIMCVIGNPPYAGESANKGDWIMELMEAYKCEPGGLEKLKERNPKWINDDYVKFIRFAEHMIAKNGEGILGFITNHGYLDNPTFRGMRWHLLRTFNKIYVLDLHGNAKKKEVAPDGTKDVNVFDIQQGVAIIIGVKHTSGKTKGSNRPGGGREAPALGDGTGAARRGPPGGQGKADVPLAQVYHADLWGMRQGKYDTLVQEDLSSDMWTLVENHAPQYPMVKRDFELEKVYEAGIKITDFFIEGQLGFQTHRDKFSTALSYRELESRLNDILDETIDTMLLKQKYEVKDTAAWNFRYSREKLSKILKVDKIIKECWYRPFEKRFYFVSKYLNDRPREELNRHFIDKANLALCVSRQLSFLGYRHILVADKPAESCYVSNKTKEGNVNFPLYLYPAEDDLDQTRRINFDAKLWDKLKTKATHPEHGPPDEVQTFDYIYGVLHCPAYRETYKEFLKIDFPRIPWPATADEFWDVSAKGKQLRALHLMEPATIGNTPYPYKGEGDSVIDKPKFKDGQVWINADQYFDTVPETAWAFYIGGYQPAQKWLKDRKGRELGFDDILHYQKIIKILSETDRIMKTITMAL